MMSITELCCAHTHAHNSSCNTPIFMLSCLPGYILLSTARCSIASSWRCQAV
jgi:hypothetical protein